MRAGPGYRPFALAAEGRAIPVQVLGRTTMLERLEARRHYPDQDEVDRVRVGFRIPAVAGLGFTTLTLVEPQPLPSAGGAVVRISETRLSSALLFMAQKWVTTASVMR